MAFNETPFIYLQSEGEPLFINLLQVVQATVTAQDRIVLQMSDGKTINLNGTAVSGVIARIAEFTMVGDGPSLVEESVRAAGKAKSDLSSSSPSNVQPSKE